MKLIFFFVIFIAIFSYFSLEKNLKIVRCGSELESKIYDQIEKISLTKKQISLNYAKNGTFGEIFKKDFETLRTLQVQCDRVYIKSLFESGIIYDPNAMLRQYDILINE